MTNASTRLIRRYVAVGSSMAALFGLYAPTFYLMLLEKGLDLAYLMGTCLSVADRRAVEADVVGAYWHELRRYGVEGYSRAECLHDYRLALLHCPLIIVLGAAHGLPQKEELL